MSRFDPKVVKRWFNDASGTMVVNAADFDALLALYDAERQARKDDALEFQREARDIAAEARWAERESHENY